MRACVFASKFSSYSASNIRLISDIRVYLLYDYGAFLAYFCNLCVCVCVVVIVMYIVTRFVVLLYQLPFEYFYIFSSFVHL